MDSNSTYTAKQYYDIEVEKNSNSTTDSTKIGLMYVSDYGFAVSPDYWNIALSSYSNAELKSNNWLYINWGEWSISSAPSNRPFYIYGLGNLSNDYPFIDNGVRPVFYLNTLLVVSVDRD